MNSSDEIHSNRDIVCLPRSFYQKQNSLENVNKSLSNVRPICRYSIDASVDNDGTIRGNVQFMKPPIYEQFERIERGFVNTPSCWHRRYLNDYYENLGDDFISSSGNLFSKRERLWQNHFGPSALDVRIENGRLSNAFSLPQRSSVGSFVIQSDGKWDNSKDSTNNEKRKLTRQYFVTTFSICYAIFLVVFGAIIFIGDVVKSQYPLPQAFCLYMLCMAFAYFLYLYKDIRRHIFHAKNELKDRLERKELIENYVKQNKVHGNRSTNVEALYAQAILDLNLPPIKSIIHKYCFLPNQNGESFYIKLGAAWFAFGLLVYSALQISYDAYFISSNGDYLYECASYTTLALNILFPLYSLFSLFFIVKYMNVVINVNENVARIFLMHSVGTSLSLWVFTIIRETADAIAESDAENYAMFRVARPNETFEFVYNDCGKSNALNAVHRQFAPYLYPFVIEYCILIVGIWCKIYANINHCPRKIGNTNGNDNDVDIPSSQNDKTEHSLSTVYLPELSQESAEHHKDIETNSHVHMNCQSSYHGIFIGLLLAIMTIVFIILMFVGFQNRSYLKTSITINNIFECTVLLILIIATIYAYTQTVKLDIKFDPKIKMDDILLVIAIPAFFMECIFSLLPAFHSGAILTICISIFRVIQVLIQTPFIIDGKRRCSNSIFLQNKKTGRGIVIFLAMANMSLWIYHTFSGKTITGDVRYSYYGYRLWNILNHISLPLIMFYRFNASVSLVDIWNQAYESAQKTK
ncbi:proton channel OtopLc-like [Contarinia nasturtii]|uniref:proton channel OtopLc-like n=1 Tax=Contarinia nasturtii TaxID=265458 RepID=UPI0012D4A1EC|nr:proton channel OtopLc-like [Contarinia nasturtii]